MNVATSIGSPQPSSGYGSSEEEQQRHTNVFKNDLKNDGSSTSKFDKSSETWSPVTPDSGSIMTQFPPSFDFFTAELDLEDGLVSDDINLVDDYDWNASLKECSVEMVARPEFQDLSGSLRLGRKEDLIKDDVNDLINALLKRPKTCPPSPILFSTGSPSPEDLEAFSTPLHLESAGRRNSPGLESLRVFSKLPPILPLHKLTVLESPGLRLKAPGSKIGEKKSVQAKILCWPSLPNDFIQTRPQNIPGNLKNRIQVNDDHGNGWSTSIICKKVIGNQGKSGKVISNQGKYGKVISNQGKSGEVTSYQGKTGDVDSNQGKSGDVVSNQAKSGEVIDNQSKSGDVINKQDKSGDVINNQGKSDEVISKQGKSGEVISKQGKSAEVISNQGKSGDDTDNRQGSGDSNISGEQQLKGATKTAWTVIKSEKRRTETSTAPPSPISLSLAPAPVPPPSLLHHHSPVTLSSIDLISENEERSVKNLALFSTSSDLEIMLTNPSLLQSYSSLSTSIRGNEKKEDISLQKRITTSTSCHGASTGLSMSTVGVGVTGSGVARRRAFSELDDHIYSSWTTSPKPPPQKLPRLSQCEEINWTGTPHKVEAATVLETFLLTREPLQPNKGSEGVLAQDGIAELYLYKKKSMSKRQGRSMSVLEGLLTEGRSYIPVKEVPVKDERIGKLKDRNLVTSEEYSSSELFGDHLLYDSNNALQGMDLLSDGEGGERLDDGNNERLWVPSQIDDREFSSEVEEMLREHQPDYVSMYEYLSDIF